MIIQRKYLTWLFVSVMITCFFSINVHANTVSNFDELSSKIAAASTDGTETEIEITADLNINETISIPQGANIVLIGNGGKITSSVSPIFKAPTASAKLTFKDLEINGKAAADTYPNTGGSEIFTVAGSGSSLNIYGATIINTDGYVLQGGRGVSATINVYGGDIKGRPVGTGCSGYLYPISDICIEGINYKLNIIPQEDKTVSDVECSGMKNASDEGNVTIEGINGASMSAPYVVATNDGITIGRIKISTTDSSTTILSTVTGNLIPEKTEAYNCGDTVKVTAKLTPDAAAMLSAGSLKFSYDTEKLNFTGAVVNEALKEGQATLYENTPGTCVASFKGDPLDVTTEGLVLAEFSFEAVKDGTADFGIIEAAAADEKASPCTTNTGDSLSVTINAVPKVTIESFGSDYKMVKYVADALPGEGNAYFIGDTALTYVPAYATGDNAGKYIFVMLSKDEPVDQIVTTKVGSYGTVTATGDANGDTQTNIIDAQVVYYMTTSKITSSDSGYDWLNSDVNGSGTLDALDAHAIQYFVHYGKFGQFSS